MTTYADETKNLEVSVQSSSIPSKVQNLTPLQDPSGRVSAGLKLKDISSDDEVLARVDSEGVYDSDDDSAEQVKKINKPLINR